MKLRFYARGDLLARVPGYTPRVGDVPRYVGRSYAVVDGLGSHPASESSYELDSTSPLAARLCKFARRGEVWCADKDTAAAIGVAFVPVKFADGEWVIDSKPAGKARE